MARYATKGGIRRIAGEGGHDWLPGDSGSWVRDSGEGSTYTMEKRTRNLRDETHSTGWYLYEDRVGGFFGEWCASRILDAVDEANRLIAKSQAI